jgi:hypothetical protein
MRKGARTGAILTVLICSAGLEGCRELEYHFGRLAAITAEPEPPQVRKVHRQKSVLKRVVAAKVVPAGDKIRSYCGQRHIRFQSGMLKESETEKARNDTLCRQAY